MVERVLIGTVEGEKKPFATCPPIIQLMTLPLSAFDRWGKINVNYSLPK